VEAVLAKLGAPQRTKSEKWATVEANLQYIIAAKRRKASWQSIAEALGEVRIDIHPETLRLFVTKHPRYIEAFPVSSELASAPSKKRRRLKRGLKSRKTERREDDANEKRVEATNETNAEAKAETGSEKQNKAATEPSSKFLKMEGPL
jgi:hypothetical protein